MTKRMLIDATQPEETRVALVENDRLDSYDFDSAIRKQIKGNIFLAKVTRVEPSLQACFVEYGGNRQGFLAFTEIHPDYYRIPVEDRQALLAEEAEEWSEEDEDDLTADAQPSEVAENQPPEMALEAVAAPAEALVAELPAEENGEGEALPEAPNLTEVERDNTIESVGGEEDEGQSNRARRMGRLRKRYKIQEVIKRRQIMLVQATKEERGGKGAAMTTYISLPGRYCVLMPNSPRGGGVSRKITDPQARRKMKDLLSELEVPHGMSVILRTAGMTRTRLDIKRDLEYLMRLWDEIRRETMQAVAPALIYEEADIFKRTIRDLYNGDTQEVIVAGEEGFKKVKQFMRQMVPAHAKRVLYYRDPLIPLFQRYGIEAQIADVFNPRVELKSGGYIIINPTEALVSIDVNSGRATRERHIDDTALKTNMEAAEEVARQLRLRDLGGLVVIDFIDMESSRHNAKVERKLREAMSGDRARIEIGRISGFGLMELSRQRLHPSLTETHFTPCAHCNATGMTRTTESAAVVVMRAIEAEAVRGRAVSITANIPQSVAIYLLNHKREEINRIEEYFGVRVALRADENMMPNDVDITFEKGAPMPRRQIDLLPVPVLEGSDDDYLVQGEEDSGEPMMSNISEPRERNNSDEDGEEEGGRSGRRRRGGRGGRGRDRDRRGRRNDSDNAESGDNARIIPIQSGEDAPLLAPLEGAEGASGEGIQNPTADGEKRKSRNRRGGGRHPYRRRRGGERGERPENGDQPAREPRQPQQDAAMGDNAEPRQRRPRHEAPAAEKQAERPREKVAANADAGAGDAAAKSGEKRGWWKKLID